jgi:hypothetical protein
MAKAKSRWISPRKEQLRKLLDTPIKFGKISEEERDAFIAAETEKRISAAFELYDIDPSTPESAKWVTLAIYLLGEHFVGCRSLMRHPGAAPGNSASAYSKPIGAFDTYCETAPPGSQKARAEWFLKSRGGSIQVGNETINSPKAFLNMYRRQKKAAS